MPGRDSLGQVTGAPVTFEHEGKTWMLAPLWLRERGQLGAFTRDYALRQYEVDKALLEQWDAPPEHMALLRQELRQARQSPLRSTISDDLEPLAYGVWLRLRRHHPELERATVEAWLDEDPSLAERVIGLCRKVDTGEDVRACWVKVLSSWIVLKGEGGGGDLTDAQRWQLFDMTMVELTEGQELPTVEDVEGKAGSPSPERERTGAGS